MVEKVETPATTPKKAKVAKVKKPKTAATHPPVSEMVTSAISTLKERGGSSLAAIKKYIASNYKTDVDKLSPFIRKYIKSAVVSGSLVQTKGKGANGSFRIGGGSNPKSASASKPKKTAATKAAKPKKAKSASPKKAAAKPKKAAAKPKKSPAAKKPKPAKKPASPKKPKAVKLAAKPKKAKASPKKKAAAKKGKK